MKTKLIYTLFLSVFSLGITSCIDEDLNTDPNHPVSVPTTSLIVSAEKQLVDNIRNEAISMRAFAVFVQQISLITYTSPSRYDIPFGYSSDYWNAQYQMLNNLQEIINLNTDPATKDIVTANGAGRNENQIAISRILKSYAYAALTDVLGNIPYESYGSDDPDFQALQQNPDNITPKYASQEKIYTDILNELKAAGDVLLQTPTETTFGAADIIYNGNNEKWAKFANSLRLRLATRLKTKNASLYQSHAADALAKGLFTSNADNAVFQYAATAPNQAPLYKATDLVGRKDFALSKPFVDLLNGDNPQLPIADPRLPFYARTNSAGEYVGLPYGLKEAEGGANEFKADQVSLPSASYCAPNYGEVLLEYAEVAFLTSEYNGWSQAAYEDGVRASLEKWGVTSADVTAYLAALPAASEQSVLNQKYIALFTQYLELWSEYRRTGYPDFLIKEGDVTFTGIIEGNSVTYNFAPLYGDGGVPARLYYSTKEQTVNKSNYQDAVEKQGNDVIETKLWVFKQ